MRLTKIGDCKKGKQRFFNSVKVLFDQIVTMDTKKITIIMVVMDDQRILDIKSVDQATELNHRSVFLKRTTNGKQLHHEKT